MKDCKISNMQIKKKKYIQTLSFLSDKNGFIFSSYEINYKSKEFENVFKF